MSVWVSHSVFIGATWVAAVFGGIGIGAAFVSAIVGYQLAEESLADANKRIAESQAEAGRANEAAGKAHERAAMLEHDASQAHERIARLNNETEILKADNLALQKLMLPRRLGSLISITSPDDSILPTPAELQFSGIKQFPGTPVVIQVVPDFEAQTLANDMLAVLTAFGWKPSIVGEARSRLSPRLIEEGVMITYTRDNKFNRAAGALADAFTKAGLTGRPFAGRMLQIVAQGYPVTPDGKPADWSPYPSFDPPIEAVVLQRPELAREGYWMPRLKPAKRTPRRADNKGGIIALTASIGGAAPRGERVSSACKCSKIDLADARLVHRAM